MLEGKLHPNVPTVPLVGLLSVSVISNNTVGDKEQWEQKKLHSIFGFLGTCSLLRSWFVSHPTPHRGDPGLAVGQ